MRTLIRLLFWNIVFVAGLAATVAGLFAIGADNAAGTTGLLLPALLGIWLLFLGGRFARRRAAVLACAAAAGLLFLLQCALLAFLIWFSQGFGGRTDQTGLFEVLLLWTVLAAGWLLWRFLRAARVPSG